MNQEDKGLELQLEKQASLAPSRDIMEVAFFHHSSPADTVCSKPQAAVLGCASHRLAVLVETHTEWSWTCGTALCAGQKCSFCGT